LTSLPDKTDDAAQLRALFMMNQHDGGFMPELNVLCGIAGVSTQSEQPVTKHLVVEVTPSTPVA
jgi:hypothetical protein